MDNFAAFKSPAIAIAIMTLFGALLKGIKSLIELNDEHLLKRPFKKLAFLEKECNGNETLTQLISKARAEQAFKTIIGRTVSPEFMAAVAALYSSDKFTLLELRTSAYYLKVVNSSISVELGKAAWFSFSISLAYIIGMGLYVWSLVAILLSKHPDSSALWSVFILLGTYMFFSWIIGKDARAVYLSSKLKSKIEALQLA